MLPKEVNATSKDSPNSEFDVRDLFVILWTERISILATVAFFTVVSIIYSLNLKDVYRAESVLMSAETRQSASPLLNQLGGAAALIGINVGADGGGSVENAIAIMRSREFILKFIAENNVLVPLFAGTWDKENGTGVNEEVFDPRSGEWISNQGTPSPLMAYRKFSELLSIVQDSSTGLVRVSIDWHDPTLAAKWVNQLIVELNRIIKLRDVKEANDAISFLQKQLESTQLVDMQRVFYQLIQSQTQVTMLADVRDEYVFQIIDTAVVPDQKVAPRRDLITAMGTLLGAVLGFLFVFARIILISPTRNAELKN